MHIDHTRRKPLSIAAGYLLMMIIVGSVSVNQLMGVSNADAWSGTIVDQKTGEPIVGAAVFRTWYAQMPSPGGAVTKLLSAQQTLSDEKGGFSIWKPLLHISIPPIYMIEEDTLIYKPGYEALVVEEKTSVIRLERVPTFIEVREKELRRVDVPRSGMRKPVGDLLDMEDDFIRAGKMIVKKDGSSSARWIRKKRRPRLKRPMMSSRKQISMEMLQQSKAFSLMSPEEKELLKRLMADSDYAVRSWAFEWATTRRLSEAVDYLLDRLESGGPKERAVAARALGIIGDPRALPSLVYVLSEEGKADYGYSIRQRAAWALGELKDPRALKVLIAACEDKHFAVRGEAIEAMGRIKDARAVPALIEILKGNVPSEKSQFLTESSRKSSVDTLRRKATEALGEIGDPRAVPALILAFQDANGALRTRIAEALGDIGDTRAADILIVALFEPIIGTAIALGGRRVPAKYYGTSLLCKAAEEALVKINGPKVVDALLARLRNEEAGIRKISARMLLAIGAPAAGPLMTFLREEVHDKGDPVLEELEHALEWNPARMKKAPGGGVRASLLDLGEIEDPFLIAQLVRALKDDHDVVRRLAIHYLSGVKNPETVKHFILACKGIDPNADRKFLGTIRTALREIGPLALDLLIEALEDEDARVRTEAATALGWIKDGRAVDPLIQALKDENEYVLRSAASKSLGRIGDRRAIEALTAMFEDASGSNRSIAAIGLIAAGTSAIEALTAFSKSEDDVIRKSAVIALSEIKDPGVVEPLVAALRDEESRIRSKAAGALWKLKDPRAVQPLIDSLTDESHRVRATAAKSLAFIKSASVEPLISVLADVSSYLRWRAAQVLGRIGDERAMKALLAALNDEVSEVRWMATWALGETGDDRAVAPLISLLKDEDHGIRKRAGEALRRMTGKDFGQSFQEWERWWNGKH